MRGFLRIKPVKRLARKCRVRGEFWVPGSQAAGSLEKLDVWLKRSGF
jgi:hypothetical protein